MRPLWPYPILVDELPAHDDARSVYEPDLRNPHPQFKEGWWHKTKDVPDVLHFTATSNGIEVARVMVKLGGRVLPDYRGPRVGAPATEILYLEVNSDARMEFRGIGAATVDDISTRFRGVMFARATEEPGGFWERLGWHEYPPTGRPEHSWRLFVRPD